MQTYKSKNPPSRIISARWRGLSHQRVLAVFWRYFYVLRRSGGPLSDLMYWPFIDILLWGMTSIWIQTHHQNTNLPLILMTGLIFWQVVWRGSIDITTNFLQEVWDRNLTNLFSTPLQISEWCLGVILVCFFKLTISLSFGACAIYLLYALNVFTIGWAFLPFAALILLFGWTIGFLSVSVILRCGPQFQSIAWLMGGSFAPFSAVFYPVELLPHWAQRISWALPTTYIFEGMRILLNGHKFPMHYFWMSLSLGIVYFIFSIGVFLYTFRKSKQQGLAKLG